MAEEMIPATTKLRDSTLQPVSNDLKHPYTHTHTIIIYIHVAHNCYLELTLQYSTCQSNQVLELLQFRSQLMQMIQWLARASYKQLKHWKGSEEEPHTQTDGVVMKPAGPINRYPVPDTSRPQMMKGLGP